MSSRNPKLDQPFSVSCYSTGNPGGKGNLITYHNEKRIFKLLHFEKKGNNICLTAFDGGFQHIKKKRKDWTRVAFGITKHHRWRYGEQINGITSCHKLDGIVIPLISKNKDYQNYLFQFLFYTLKDVTDHLKMRTLEEKEVTKILKSVSVGNSITWDFSRPKDKQMIAGSEFSAIISKVPKHVKRERCDFKY